MSKVVLSPSRYLVDIGFDVVDSAIRGGLRVGGYLYALMTEISKEEAEKIRKAKEAEKKEQA